MGAHPVVLCLRDTTELDFNGQKVRGLGPQRAKHNRCLPEGDKLWERTCAGEPLGQIVFTMPSRHGIKERKVRQELDLPRTRCQALL
jgi:hypothetical protein